MPFQINSRQIMTKDRQMFGNREMVPSPVHRTIPINRRNSWDRSLRLDELAPAGSAHLLGGVLKLSRESPAA